MSESTEVTAGLVVRVAGNRWLLLFSSVIEVVRRPILAPLPPSRGSAIGVINHRGNVLIVADPIRALELPGAGTSGADVVVVDAQGQRFGIAVDGVVELVSESRTGIATLDLDAVALAVFGEPT